MLLPGEAASCPWKTFQTLTFLWTGVEKSSVSIHTLFEGNLHWSIRCLPRNFAYPGFLGHQSSRKPLSSNRIPNSDSSLALPGDEIDCQVWIRLSSSWFCHISLFSSFSYLLLNSWTHHVIGIMSLPARAWLVGPGKTGAECCSCYTMLSARIHDSQYQQNNFRKKTPKDGQAYVFLSRGMSFRTLHGAISQCSLICRNQKKWENWRTFSAIKRATMKSGPIALSWCLAQS